MSTIICDQVALVNQSPDLVLMFLLHCEHLFCLLDHPMLMNALYMHTICDTKIHITMCIVQHLTTPYLYKIGKELQSFIFVYNIASTESGKSRHNLRFHRKMGTLFCLPNAFAASALMMALSTLLVTMHVDFVIQ